MAQKMVRPERFAFPVNKNAYGCVPSVNAAFIFESSQMAQKKVEERRENISICSSHPLSIPSYLHIYDDFS